MEFAVVVEEHRKGEGEGKGKSGNGVCAERQCSDGRRVVTNGEVIGVIVTPPSPCLTCSAPSRAC